MAEEQHLSGNNSDSDVAESSVSVATEELKTLPTKSKKRARTPRASKKDLDLLSSKVDKLFTYFQKMSDTAVSDRQRPPVPRDTAISDGQRPVEGNRHEDTVSEQRPRESTSEMSHRVPLSSRHTYSPSEQDDIVSLQPGQRELNDLLGSDEGDNRSCKSEDIDIDGDRFTKYSANTNRLLAAMFGDDAVTKPSKNLLGITLDDSQIAVIKESWRSEDPSRLTAFKDSYRAAFPISDKDDDILKVPSLDDIIDHLLLKRYGSKAISKSSLHSQPLKSIEKLAYQGQMSARMGMIINIYIQQALGNLLSSLQEKDVNIDQCIQCVRDIFAMSTKTLDQSARSGTFHHLIRRRSAMADTGTIDFKDLKASLWTLPLSHTGVFGEGLEKKLKDRQEINKQIGDLLPEVSRKRKSFTSETQSKQWKRPRFSEEKSYPQNYQRKPQYNRSSSYTIPKRSATVTSNSTPDPGTLLVTLFSVTDTVSVELCGGHDSSFNSDPQPDSQGGSNEEAEVGVIEKISLKNFMCHNRLDVPLGSNVNFIIGNNGSGKSAVVTALVVGLGGKASVTNRGSSMKGFVKNGKQSAEVEIKLRNRGTDAFEPEHYGDTILVHRKFSVDGSSSYKLKSKQGKLVSTKKDDLIKILDQFNIQVDNPLAILNQDTSRNFLNSKNASDKYKFFLKATQLEQIKEEYGKAGEQKEITKDIIEQKQLTLPKLEREVLAWEQKFKSIMAIDDLRQKITTLKSELAWAFVIEKEKGLSPIEKEQRHEESKLPRYKQHADKAKTEVDDVSKRKTDLLDRLTSSGNEVQTIQPVHKEARNNMTEQKKIARTAQMDLKKHEASIAHLKKDRDAILERIKDLQASAQHDYEAQKRQRQEEINAMQGQLDSYTARETTTDHELEQFRSAVTKYKNDQYNIVKEAQVCERQIEKDSRNLDTLRSSQGNQLKRYGQFMPRVMKEIDDYARQGMFHRKPIGPLGASLTLKDQKWALAVESCLKGLITAFCCHDHNDEHILERIFTNCCPGNYKPVIIVSKFQDKVYDVSRERARSADFPTLLDVIHTDNPVVVNTLIDQAGRLNTNLLSDDMLKQGLMYGGLTLSLFKNHSNLSSSIVMTIECVLMIEDGRVARRVMDPNNGHGVPEKAREAFTITGDQVLSHPTFRYYSSNQDTARYLTANVEDNIAELTRHIQELKKKREKLNTEKNQLQREIDKNMRQERQTEIALMKIREKKREVTMKIQELKSIEDPIPVDVATYEGEVELLEEQIKEQETLIETKQEVYDKEESKLKELEAKCKEIEADMRAKMEAAEAIKEEVSNIDNEIETKKSAKKHYDTELKKQEKKIKDLKERIEKYKADIETDIGKAQQIHEERINTRRAPHNLESEIVQITKQIENEERNRGDPVEITKNYKEKRSSYFQIKKEVAQLRKFIMGLDATVAGRLERYKEFRRLIGQKIKYFFLVLLNNRGYTGKITFNHQKELLELSVQPQATTSQQGEGAKDLRALSGGERSFSTVCFILAMWEAVESPFRCLDEFDIFMDMVNRRISMEMMMKTAKDQLCRQFIFLSPLDMSKLGIQSPRMRIFQMPNPERGQQTLNFTQQDNEDDQ